MGHEIGHEDITKKLEAYPHVEVSYDGMQITC